MEAAAKQTIDEVKHLKACINDLVGLVALPTIWNSGDPCQIVCTVLDVLLETLSLDFVLVRFKNPVDDAPIDVVRVDQSQNPAQPLDISPLISAWFQSDPFRSSMVVPNPSGEGDLSIAPLRLGLHDEIGVLVAASRRADFPKETERLLLRVAANQAAIGLQEARLWSEEKRVARELDQKVAQRTRELAAANEELRKEIAERTRAEEKLRQDENELRRITDAIPHAIKVLSPDGRLLHANAFVLDYTGLNLEEIQTEGPGAGIHSDDLQTELDVQRKGFSRGEPFETEIRARRKDGQYRWFLTRHNPFHDENGNITRWYATGTDIDDRKRAEERVRNENLALREEIDRSSMYEEMVGSSAQLGTVISQIGKVAPTDSTVLIFGETGTGKELIATAIQKRSKRSGKPFIRVNCAAIPTALIASELFGHEKGAFTGALQRRVGRFESAHCGTIFLDEVGELPPEVQVALLRILQEREFERVGSNRSIPIDVRVLAATNRDLEAAVAAGTFRKDLFYRLNVFPIRVPSLRERKDDIPLLVEYLVERYAKRAGKHISHIKKKTLDLFQAYDWPGNVRELQNVVERAVVLCDGGKLSVDEAWLPRKSIPPLALGALAADKKQFIERERKIIEAALAECHGRVSGRHGAAAKLGVPHQTLQSKIARLGIDKYQFKARPSK